MQGTSIIDLPVQALKEAWQQPFGDLL
jgi:hypothetical protein